MSMRTFLAPAALCLLFAVVPGCLGDTRCTAISGTCQTDTRPCTGEYKSGLCSGPTNRRCCAPVSGDDSACWARGGTCQVDVTNRYCPGSYVTGKCAGSNSRKCCDLSSKSGSCSAAKIISRAQWGAATASSVSPLTLPVGLFFVHHTAGPHCMDQTTCSSRVRGIQNYHMKNKGWVDIGYSFLVGEDGNIYEGRGWNRVGAHTQGYNSRSLAVSFIGTFETRTPGSLAIMAAKNLLACAVPSRLTSSYRLYGHRDAGTTSCPGTALYSLIKTWPRYSTTPL